MKSEQELDAEARRLRRLAEQDMEDRNDDGPQSVTPRETVKSFMVIFLLIAIALSLIWLFTGCLTIQTRTTRITSLGPVKLIEVNPTTGFVRIEDAGSPLQALVSSLNTGLFAWLSNNFIR